MTEALVPSYLSGQWLTPDNPSRVADVHDASTGEVIARVSAEGLDIAGAIDYARSTGREGLQKLTFHERALKLKELAIYLQDHREELYELANKAGANKRDNFVDIDGGISTMFTFSSKGRREMPNSTVMPDGEAEVFSKDGSFIGRHIYTSIPGVAVQINAFNFPVWGMLEKFAPAFIAGVPSIVKPATPTGYITAACVRLMIDSGILPEGSLQLISGSARDMLDHLDYRDHVAFTGSADTANTLRAHHNVIEGGIQFSAEADSLNAAILGTDVTADSPEFEAFVKAVFGEMTSKAGQKCTAIRRAIVPHALVDATIEALSTRLRDKVVVGDPRDASATMGPLVSADQKQDVAEAVEKLKAGGGEELGGVRGILHYMQRTAIQGTPDHLTAITGQWHRGAAAQRVTRADVENGQGTHPFRKDLATLQIGDQFASDLRHVSLEEILEFAEKTGDTFYAHTDEEAATANPFFPRRVAHGYLLVSWAAGLFVEPAPGPVLANYGLENLRFITPVTYDDSIRVELTAKRITPRVTDDYGEVCWDAVLYNQEDEIVATYDVLTLVEKVNTTYA